MRMRKLKSVILLVLCLLISIPSFSSNGKKGNQSESIEVSCQLIKSEKSNFNGSALISSITALVVSLIAAFTTWKIPKLNDRLLKRKLLMEIRYQELSSANRELQKICDDAFHHPQEFKINEFNIAVVPIKRVFERHRLMLDDNCLDQIDLIKTDISKNEAVYDDQVYLNISSRLDTIGKTIFDGAYSNEV